MYRTLDDFFEEYTQLAEGTGQLLDALEDKHLSQAVSDGHRTIGQIAWHIVVTVPEMMSRTGLDLSAIDHQSPPPNSAREIADAYGRVAEELVHGVKSSWSDASLEETDDMYGQEWARGKSLTAVVHHEIHHRAQLTVLMRQAGIAVPGLYGPSKEEWSKYGMEEPAY